MISIQGKRAQQKDAKRKVRMMIFGVGWANQQRVQLLAL